MRKIKTAVLTLIATIAVAAPATASASYLSTSQARRVSNHTALRQWSPITLLPEYSLATRWDGIFNHTRCVRFSSSNIHCVVSTFAQDYTVDSFGDSSGYAYCVGDVAVRKFSFSRTSVRSYNLSCDSTDDLDS